MSNTSFTPQEIEQFLQQFFDVVGARQYIGARYVPIFGRSGSDTVEWDDLAPYEPLTVVMHDGVSYVSRRYVPAGIEITDTAYWVETYRFNAQVEQYRQEVLGFQDQIDDKVPYPDPNFYPRFGTIGQVLSTLADGTTKWEDPVVPSDAQAEEVISQWLEDHPEATTTVEDASLTFAKLAPSLIARLVHSEGTLQLNDADDAAFNSIFASGGGTYDNTPDGFAGNGVLITFASQPSTSTISPRVQLICATGTNTMWWRSIWGSSSSIWSDWQQIATGADVQTLYSAISTAKSSARVLHAGDGIETVTSANDLPNNSIVYGSLTNLTDLPSGITWVQAFVVTLAGRSSETNGGVRIQLAASCNSATQELYMRTIWGSSASVWTAWVPIATPDTFNAMMNTGDNRRFVRSKHTLDGTTEEQFDVGNAPWNSIAYGGTATCTGLPDDIPTGNFILFTLATQTGTGSISPRMQVLWTANSANYEMYIRNIWGSAASVWSPWTKMITERNVLTTIEPSIPELVAKNPDDLFTMGAFDRIAGVGDSYMQGAIYPNGGSSGVASGLDTGIARQIAKHCNTTVVKYAQGGRGAYNFIHDNDNNLAQLITDGTANPYDLVIIEFGINDCNSSKTFGGVAGGMSYLGSSADIAADYHNNANTFWGQMSYIISALKEAFPTRRIALMGICSDYGASTVTKPAFNNAISEIATYHGVAFLDMQNDPIVKSQTYKDLLYGAHPNYQAYSMLAKAADRAFSRAAYNNSYLQEYYGAYGA